MASESQKAGVYLSIPFCRQKCTYCNFASDAFAQTELPRYLHAVEAEIAQCNDLWSQSGLPAHRRVVADSIYLGGGTPGLLSGEQLGRLLSAARATFDLSPDSEITLEASPENVSEASAAAWAAAGINRVSMGVQSMVLRELRATGRMHDAEMVARACEALRQHGICNHSVDLIAGLPHQTQASWDATLDAVLHLKPEHISVYMLEVDDDSRLGAELRSRGARYGAAAVPSEEQVAAFYLSAIERLTKAGFEHYEISNFAHPGRRSRHNEKHWIGAPYYGFGLDAHSYDGSHRWANLDSLPDYLRRVAEGFSPIHEWRRLDATERSEERFFLGLRRREGLPLAALVSEHGAADSSVAAAVSRFREVGWLETRDGRLRLTDQGILFSNEVFAGFLAD
jgi:oxygen-independent coproporphyrinogen-3 oxidase